MQDLFKFDQTCLLIRRPNGVTRRAATVEEPDSTLLPERQVCVSKKASSQFGSFHSVAKLLNMVPKS